MLAECQPKKDLCPCKGWLVVDNKLTVPPKKKPPKKPRAKKPKAPPPKRPPATLNNAQWISSDARQLIAQDIIDGRVPPHGTKFDATEVFNRLYHGHAFFADFPFDHKRHKLRIKSLQKIIAENRHWAKFDDEALTEDLKVFPRPTHNIRGQLRWDGSDAQRLLAIDVADKKHVGVKPKELRASRPEFMLFDLTVFRKHVDQCNEATKEFRQTPGQAKKKKTSRHKLGGEKHRNSNDS